MSERKPEITWRFNAALFAYLVFVGMLEWPFTPRRGSRPVIPIDSFADKSPELALFTAFLLGVLLLFVATKVLRLFWSKFVTNIFNVREITIQEALSCVLVLAIFAK